MAYRRTLLAALGGSVATGLVLTLGSDSAQANELEIDGLNIPNEDYETEGPINKARLYVDGQYQYETSVEPDEGLLRLELKYAGSWEQTDAKRLNGLTESHTDSFDLEGNLFDHSMIDPVDLSPQDVGESKSLEFSVRVRLTIRHDGRDLKTLESTDTARVTVSMSKAELTGSIGGSGSIEISE